MIELNVFDFDGTIYDGDSSINFYLFSLKRNFSLIRYLPIQIYGFILYKLKIRSKEYFKEKYFSFLKGIKNVEDEVNNFWLRNEEKIKKNLLENKDNIVVISASPEFLLKEICNSIGTERLIATIVDKNTGKFLGKNCRGIEKVNRLKEEYKDFIIKEFYSDSKSDKYLAEISKKSFLVKKNKIKEWSN